MENLTHYKIHISKLNEVYLKVECDNPMYCELVQYFTLKFYKFMPAYRNKMWDGKIDYSQIRQVKYMLVY